ncbi:COG2958 family protein [Lysinibacillus fusiformis]|uniref:COG2958 family protein n=1 Tax=Lysinibacillus fusiformis TaxID=28031 RepID=UPI0021C14F71|nr:HTH domain-containing protein [Lysinibacillus fusiformis]UXJ68187.1 HTH domain-containing protein [Lysinibacillus fusiformis]
MNKITFGELAIKVLQESSQPLTVEEMWEFAVLKGYDKQLGTNGKTPWRTMGAKIYVDLKDNPGTPFIKIDSKPKKFFLKDHVRKNNDIKTNSTATVLNVKKENEVLNKPTYSERDLHPFLSYFVYTYLNVYTKTIYHEKSSKRSFNQWLHPDIVGINFPIGEWQPEVLDFGLTLGGQLSKLCSFELKKELNFANIREAFFQSVSNSSWANEGYLVTAKIINDEEFMTELKRLTSSFGIGIIKLNIDEPDESEILFPAKPKNDIDWETVNKLSKENPDFSRFIKRIRNDLNTKEIIKEHYDKIFSSEQLIERIKFN